MKDWLHGRGIHLPHRPVPGKQAGATDAPARAGPAAEGRGTPVLLVILDENSWGRIVQGLMAAAYQVQVARGLEQALADVAGARPALVIVGGPADTRAYEALRAATAAPILSLLVESGEAGTLNVLAAGADDCQPATLGTRELVCRVHGLLRRSS